MTKFATHHFCRATCLMALMLACTVMTARGIQRDCLDTPCVCDTTVAIADDPEVLIQTDIASTTPEEPKYTGKIYRSVEQMPRFPGEEAQLMKHLAQNIQYPIKAAENKIQGSVITQFIVYPDGHIGNVNVVHSCGPLLDAEAVRVVSLLPPFEPGRHNGQPVAVYYTLPITFRMQ